MPNNKNRLLYILNLLYHESDEEHPITITQILERLQQAEIEGNRRTVARDLEILTDNGFDVICNKSRQNQYFIGERHFEMPELRLLVDAVQASRFISVKKSKQLIKKLSAFISIYQASELNRHLFVEKQVKAENEQALYTVDMLNAAINDEKQVCFKYYEYDQNKDKVFKHNGRVYRFSPYSLIWNNDRYYVLGYSESHGKMVKFRVERIAACEITDTPAVPKPKDFCIEEYTKSVFQMYDAEMRSITLLCDNSMMKTVIDRFGNKVEINIVSDNQFEVTVDVSVSSTFYGWLVGCGGKMTIVAPDEVKNNYRKLLLNLSEGMASQE